ncbi:MAG: hypothetical protein WC760_07630 [Bacteroidia bacterium]|jgi:hypothetical protein
MNNSIRFLLIPAVMLCLILTGSPALLGIRFTPVFVFMLMGWIAYQLLNRPVLDVKSGKAWTERKNRIAVICSLVLSIAVVYWAGLIFRQQPVDIEKSDIIPLMRDVYFKRLWTGEFVYAILNGYGYGEWTPNYLPMHWMPFIPAFLLQVDPRWIVVLVMLIALNCYTLFVVKLETGLNDKIAKIIFPFTLIFYMMFKQPAAVAHTVEWMIAGFYILLGIGLTQNNRTLTAAGFSFTLMSRYMSVFYLPIDIYTHWKEKNKKQVWIYLAMLAFILFIYIIPFLLTDPTIFLNGAKAYDLAAFGEWKGQAWQQPGERPYQLFQGYGLASWYYSWFPGNLNEKIHALKLSLLISMGLMIIALLVSYRYYGKHPLFRVVACWLILGVFTSFVLVPYNYLFWNFMCMMLVPLAKIPWIKSTPT